MQCKYTLNANENCNNCKKCNKKDKEFPFVCKLNGKHTGMLIKCDAWEKEEI